VDAPERIQTPRIRKSFLEKNPHIKETINATLKELDDTWYETTLDAATTAGAMKLKDIQAAYGEKSVCSLGGARTSCESAYYFQKFTRHTLNSPHVDNCARVCHSPSLKGMRLTIGEGAASNPFDDIYKTEFMIVVDHIKYWHPLQNPINPEEVVEYIIGLKRRFHIGMLTYDQWASQETILKLRKASIPNKLTRFNHQYKNIIYRLFYIFIMKQVQ
jgi:hypothetical protein